MKDTQYRPISQVDRPSSPHQLLITGKVFNVWIIVFHVDNWRGVVIGSDTSHET